VIDRSSDVVSSSPTSVADVAPLRGRALLIDLYDAAVAGAAPGPLTTAALRDFEAVPTQRLWLYAIGKAAHPMAAAALSALQRSRHVIAAGVIVAPELLPSPYATVNALAGDHPLPGRGSFAAAQRIGELAAGMRSDDVAIVLISGGASSLIGAPLRGMTESDLIQLYELLLGSGLDIRQMNAVRRRFTRWGGGRLALALAPARTHAFIVSDVAGDSPADIASGPCTPDPTTVHEVLELLQRTALYGRIAPSMRDYLTGVVRGLTPETPRESHPAFAHVSTRVIGSNRLATTAAAERAAACALPVVSCPTLLAGDASQCGTTIASTLVARARDGWHGCMIWGGETTVQLSSDPAQRAPHATNPSDVPTFDPPKGGRCQELALAASRVFAEAGDAARQITLLAAGTDGRDGPTDAAGAFADASVWPAIRDSGRAPELALAQHDSYVVLDAVGALHRRGLTGTNVMDVVIGVIE
jgi:hydroxypyruvate reductase